MCTMTSVNSWLPPSGLLRYTVGPELTHKEGRKAGFEINSVCHLRTTAVYFSWPQCKLLFYLYNAQSIQPISV